MFIIILIVVYLLYRLQNTNEHLSTLAKYPHMAKHVSYRKFNKIRYMYDTILKLLNQYRINYWSDYGTLLGVIRDNDIIPWDYDVDFSILEDEIPKIDTISFKQSLIDHGLILKKSKNNAFKVYYIADIGKDGPEEFYAPKTHTDIYVHVDKKGIISRTCKYKWLKDKPCSIYKVTHKFNEVFPLKQVYLKYFDRSINIPNNAEGILTKYYGDWKVPKYTHI